PRCTRRTRTRVPACAARRRAPSTRPPAPGGRRGQLAHPGTGRRARGLRRCRRVGATPARHPRAVRARQPDPQRLATAAHTRALRQPSSARPPRAQTRPSAPRSSEAPGPSSVPSRSRYAHRRGRRATVPGTGALTPYWLAVALLRETEPWASLLETGRADER